MTSLDTLFANLGVQFNNPDLLQVALTHRSYVHEHYQWLLPSNERLEFLGDSVLNFLAAQYLYHAFPDRSEGELTSMRANLVRAASLARFARQLGVGRYLKLGKGETRSGGSERDSLLADTFEAIVAAIYIDQGMAAAERFLQPLLEAENARLTQEGLQQDHKSRLQERVQSARGKTPRYRTINFTGPDHDRIYTRGVFLGEELLGEGVGNSKQLADQAAARAALENLDNATGTASASA